MKSIILLGGKSSRMGTEKYKMEVDGIPMYKRLAGFMNKLGVEFYFSINESQKSDFVGQKNVLIDTQNAIGPIGGLLSGIEHDASSDWLLLACDLMNLSKTSLECLFQENEEGYDIVTYQIEGSNFFETTCTIYRSSCFDKVRTQVEKGNYSLQSILKTSHVKKVSPTIKEELKNFNYPEDI